MKLLEIIAKKYLNAFLKGTPLDNHYSVESLYFYHSLNFWISYLSQKNYWLDFYYYN